MIRRMQRKSGGSLKEQRLKHQPMGLDRALTALSCGRLEAWCGTSKCYEVDTRALQRVQPIIRRDQSIPPRPNASAVGGVSRARKKTWIGSNNSVCFVRYERVTSIGTDMSECMLSSRRGWGPRYLGRSARMTLVWALTSNIEQPTVPQPRLPRTTFLHHPQTGRCPIHFGTAGKSWPL